MLAELDDRAIDVLPIGTDYPPDVLLARHSHRRAQLLYGATGVMRVETDDGSWTVPTDRAVLIPAGTEHEVRMLGVTTWSLYIEADTVPWWPGSCMVVEVGSLLRELLRTANDFGADYDVDGRDGAVIRLALLELQGLSPIPLSISLPSIEPFRSLCRAFLADPQLAVGGVEWAREARMSTRTFDRRFRSATGTSPGRWRARARLLASLQMIRTGTIAATSGRLGYASPAAFTAAFTLAFGAPPTRFR